MKGECLLPLVQKNKDRELDHDHDKEESSIVSQLDTLLEALAEEENFLVED